MLKHKKFLFLLPLALIFLLPSCKPASEPYPILRFNNEPDKEEVSEHLTVTGSLIKEDYDASKNEVLKLDGLTITIDGVNQNLIDNRKNDNSDLESGGFFVCSRDDFPTSTIIGSDYKATTNVEKLDFTFYIATVIKIDDVYKTLVSQSFKVSITNADAIKPWVWYTVTAVVIFGVIGMVMFTRHYKAKKEGKI